MASEATAKLRHALTVSCARIARGLDMRAIGKAVDDGMLLPALVGARDLGEYASVLAEAYAISGGNSIDGMTGAVSSGLKRFMSDIEEVARGSVDLGMNGPETARYIRDTIGITPSQLDRLIDMQSALMAKPIDAIMWHPRRDKRFDNAIRKAVENNITIPRNKIAQMVAAYAINLRWQAIDDRAMYEVEAMLDAPAPTAFSDAAFVRDDMDSIIEALVESLWPALANAFITVFRDIRQRVNITALEAALEAYDIEGAIDALNVEPGSFNAYVLARQSIAVKAGEAVAAELTRERKSAVSASPPRAPVLPGAVVPGGGSIFFRFDMTNPRAEAMMREQSAARVTGYIEEQKEAARRIIANGYSNGDGPKTIATEIAGRVNPASGRREGGIIGLSNPQVQYVENMRARLSSGDPAEMRKVLGRYKDGKWVAGTGMTLRNRSYDRSIIKAIKDIEAGKSNPLKKDKIDQMVAKYSDRLIARRAEDIARTETAQGVEMARMETTRQALEKAGLPYEAVQKFWIHQGGTDHARNWHLAMNNVSVRGLETLFELPDGSLMQHPHDPQGGPVNNVNCRCALRADIDWGYGLF